MTQDISSEQRLKLHKKKMLRSLIIFLFVWVLIVVCSMALSMLGIISHDMSKGIILGSLIAAVSVSSVFS